MRSVYSPNIFRLILRTPRRGHCSGKRTRASGKTIAPRRSSRPYCKPRLTTPSLWRGSARFMHAEGKRKKRSHCWHMRREISHAPQIRTEWAVVLAHLHKYKEAQGALAGLSPPSGREESIRFHRLKASVALGLGNAPGAATEMEAALALSPTDNALTLATAVAESQAKNWKRAAHLAEPLFSRTQEPQTGLICLEAELEMHGDFHPTLEALRATQLATSEATGFSTASGGTVDFSRRIFRIHCRSRGSGVRSILAVRTCNSTWRSHSSGPGGLTMPRRAWRSARKLGMTPISKILPATFRRRAGTAWLPLRVIRPPFCSRRMRKNIVCRWRWN